MKIALCLIVKGTNKESLLLDQCLESIEPYVDGLFITRTTKKGEKRNAAVANVALKYGAVLSDFEWINDFAAARTFNFSQVPKDFDYIMWSDADDIWRGVEKLRKTLEKNPHSDGFGFWYLYDWDEHKKPVVVHRKTMIIKNDGCASWVGALHEDLQPNRQVDISLIEGIERLHITSKERSDENAKRNLEIAKSQAKISNDPRDLWNLANSMFAVSDFIGSKKAFEQFVEESHSNEEIYLAHMRLGNVFKALGKREECIKSLQLAIGLEPNLPDAYLQLAYYFYDFGDMAKAEQYALTGVRKRPQIMKMIVYNPRDYDYNPMMLLAKIYYSINRPDYMLTMLEGCQRIYPNDKNLKETIKQAAKEKKMLGEALKIVQRLQKIKDKKKLKAELDKVPKELQSHPAIAVIRNENFIKETSTGKDLVIYCGNTIEQWNPELFKTKMVGGSEEAVINLAREFAKLGWNVTVYNNCGHKVVRQQLGEKFVEYRPFWEFNYRDKQDAVILWRWAKPLDADINAPRIFIDLHDVVSEGELTEKRLAKLTKIFVKTKFHRSLFPNVPDKKFAIIPNGLEIYPDKTIERDPFLIINTSSPDRSMDVLPKLFKEVKKQEPEARLQWAYGWEGFKNAHSGDQKKMDWMEKTKQEMEDAGIESLGRIPQEEVGKLYQKASLLLYPTEFAEIDCISVKKAQAAGCMPVTTDFGALDESVQFGFKVHSKKTKDNWNKPYQFHFGLEDEEAQQRLIDMVCELLPGGKSTDTSKWAEQFKWKNIAERWNKELCA